MSPEAALNQVMLRFLYVPFLPGFLHVPTAETLRPKRKLAILFVRTVPEVSLNPKPLSPLPWPAPLEGSAVPAATALL